MYQNNLEELLVSDISDCSDVDPSESGHLKLVSTDSKQVNYDELLDKLLQDKESDCDSDSLVEATPISRIEQDPVSTEIKNKRETEKQRDEEVGRTSEGGKDDSLFGVDDQDGRSNDLRKTEYGKQYEIERDKQSCQNSLETTDKGACGSGVAGDMPSGQDCCCQAKCNTFINHLLQTCGPMFQNLSSVVHYQLLTKKNIHKVRYITVLNEGGFTEDEATCDPGRGSYPSQLPNDLEGVESSKLCMERLGISHKKLEKEEKHTLLIRQRHNISDALGRLGLFNDSFIHMDSQNIKEYGIIGPETAKVTCITANNQFVVGGTSSGTVIIGDIGRHKLERNFSPNTEFNVPNDNSENETLSWQEIDKTDNCSVTYVDVFSGSNWITAGYSNGVVKLMHLNKNMKHGSNIDKPNVAVPDGQKAPDKTANSRGFGIMADAVSSALGGFKKSGSHALCFTKVFLDSIALCKFTIVDSHEEIICTNKKSVALITYSKTVLSHNLTVNNLQAFNAAALESDEVVDIACLRSNPQSKYIRGIKTESLVAIATTTKCVVISTRPEVSILFRVPFHDYPKKSPTGSYAIYPSIAWMVLNNNGGIKPLLLIMLANRLSFALCDISTEKRGATPIVCTNVGYIKFPTYIRGIRIVSRDLLAVIDGNNVLQVIQVNIFREVMYYDVVRSLNLSEEDASKELWQGMMNLSSIISVQTRTVKMVANSYKKFSALVSELFGGKRNEMFFELRVACLYVLTDEGIMCSELHSWIKTVGELTVTKNFVDSLAICHALHQGLIPGLLDYKPYIENIQKLILYVLHQSAAHIIRLAKLMDTGCINMLEDANEGWTDNVRVDITSQLDALCCSMFDVCITLKMYESLNDLIYRCFATLKIENLFVKYVMMNYLKGRLGLAQLKPEIFETILDLYDNVLDYITKEYFTNSERIDDYLLFLRDQVTFNREEGCNLPIPECDFKIDGHILVYEVLCDQLSDIYAFCSKNEIPLSKEKAVCRLSKYSQWHCFIYCPELIGNDISLALDVLSSEASNILKSRQGCTTLSASLGTPLSYNVEDIFVVRVLFSVLNSCLNFQNCVPYTDSAVSNFCKVIGYLTSNGSFKPSFPITSDIIYARPELEYEDELIDMENIDRLTFRTTLSQDFGFCPLQRLMATSPRLLFTCLSNLFLNSNSTFEDNADILGTKIELFNFMLNALIGCLNQLDQLQATFTIRQMLSMFIVGASVFSDSFYLDLRTQVVAVYTLLTETGTLDHVSLVETEPLNSEELMLEDGSFNSNYYFNMFCKKVDGTLENVRQLNISKATTSELLKMHIRKSLFTIYQKFDCQTNWTKNSHFSNLQKFYRGLIPLAGDLDMRFFLCEAVGDYEKVIHFCESRGPEKFFDYLQSCVNCFKGEVTQENSTLNQMLLRDPILQKEFVLVLMNSVARLIRVDLQRSTQLLVKLFSLPNIADVFSDPDLKHSQEIVLSTLKDFPELQLMVLSALLALDKGNSPNDYFRQYLRLLAQHDKGNVCQILKRQKKLNITSCLEICMSADIQDAVAYLLMRAGDFEGAANWILKALKSSAGDIDMRKRLVDDAQYMCTNFEEHIAYETMETLWFGILDCLISDLGDEKVANLIEEVFTVGILKFTKLTRALVELQKYESVEVSTFKSSLEKLLCHLECQTFMINKASTMASEVLNMQFRRGMDFNKQGVVVEVPETLGERCLRCQICKQEMILASESDGDDARDLGPAAQVPRSTPYSPQINLDDLSISPFEQNLGVIYTLPSLAVKNEKGGTLSRNTKFHLTNLYNDRLSTFLTKKQWSNSNRASWNFSTMGLAPQFLPAFQKQLDGSKPWKPINIFWCGHVFHVSCAPNKCPTCCTD